MEKPFVRLVLVPLVLIISSAQAKTAEEIYTDVSPSVVVVNVKGQRGTGIGSGVVISPGEVITNCHVVNGAKSIVVTTDSGRFHAVVRYGDTIKDLCQLKVSGLSAPPVEIETKPLRIGQRVYAIGNPQGLQNTLSDGLISAIRNKKAGFSMLQISAPITFGSSGGGLFNEDGKLVGITTSGLGEANLNFAIPAEHVTSLKNVVQRAEKEASEKIAALADSVKLALSRQIQDERPPNLVFSDIEERIKYLHWLAELSERLKPRISDMTIRRELLQTVFYEAKRAGLDPALVLAIIDYASGFDQFNVTKSGARGLMAVAPSWTNAIGDNDPQKLFKTRANLRYGCSILRLYLDMERGDLFLALGHYGDTPGKADYPNAILQRWKKYEFKQR